MAPWFPRRCPALLAIGDDPPAAQSAVPQLCIGRRVVQSACPRANSDRDCGVSIRTPIEG